MWVLSKTKIIDFMTKRKEALYNQLTRDFGSGFAGREHEHREVKYWQEAIERGEFDEEVLKVYVILAKTQPEIVDFSFYTDEETVRARVEYLNNLGKGREFWYLTLYNNVKDSGKLGKLGNTDG